MELYPTLEVPVQGDRSVPLPEKNPIPIQLTEEDFQRVARGEFLTRVTFLPAPERRNDFKPISGSGSPARVLASFDYASIDVVEKAAAAGTILAVLRLGNIDLEGPGPKSGAAPDEESQIRFVSPPGMKVSGKAGKGEQAKIFQGEAPMRLSLRRGESTALKLRSIPGRPGEEFTATLEVGKGGGKAGTLLSHAAIPVSLRDKDFAQLKAGKAVVRVTFLPNPAKVEQVRKLVPSATGDPWSPVQVSSSDYPDGDVVKQAAELGSILAVIRLEK
jgi:hypothetical protein